MTVEAIHRPAVTVLRPSVRVSTACFIAGALWHVLGWLGLAVAAADVLSFYYQPRVLAVVHSFTLGWISLTMMGVLYQYVPALTKQPLPWPRLAGVQVGAFFTGVCGLVTHFWIGHPVGMKWSAEIIAASVLLFVIETAVPLRRAERKDATMFGLAAALACLFGTATLGLLFAIDKVHPFLGGSVLSNIAGHAHLGLLGWIALTICTVSYRMVAAFALPTEVPLAAQRRQIVALALIVPALVIALLLRSRVTVWCGVAAVAAMGWYVGNVARLLATRRLPLDWSLRHVLAAQLHLALGALCGLALLTIVDPGSETGSRVSVAYALLLLAGWVSNYIVGMGTRMMPGLLGHGPHPILSVAGRATVFALLNAGVVTVIVSVAMKHANLLRIGALASGLAGLLFAGALVREGGMRR